MKDSFSRDSLVFSLFVGTFFKCFCHLNGSVDRVIVCDNHNMTNNIL
jgi:hypothetical protein